ncbi:hypothetical protein [Pseudomonas monteilii]|uniref:hypothetical protein n=1 Tax=Pseudomonas monteilii TaxID=76759 RepID=UPI001CBBB3BB|nr:hypothetical protein [Pseudomonas monteilii]MBZ3665529.1 hypothetical protein [Pseudomonas monteilii]MBZ3670873.1 hypothetical protein [Pseudomonas monteilii]
MRKDLGLAKRCGFTLLALAVIGLPIGLFAGGIDFGHYAAVATVWLLVAAMLIMGESVTEVTLWKASIKRDVQAARDARYEAEAVRDELRTALRSLIDASEIGFSVARIFECPDEVLERRSRAVERLQVFAEPDEDKRQIWIKDLRTATERQ